MQEQQEQIEQTAKQPQLSESTLRRQERLPVYLFIWHICNCPTTKKKGITPIFPMCRTSWLKGVKAGIYPKPFKTGLGKRQNAWRTEDILSLAEKISRAK
ncbi:hypothetical protein [Methylobacter sp. BlB1]|uniref:hypothetical protein n=1 Tax=Methylobacter sp. BlB1 TaxID=2785914 RepID=UPI00189405D5|nr:hypothetical protein [Methylobacter sp. BlB1]MBF6647183.1 hypothetical protein [Methylobacter sp. BlB1]